MAVWEVKEDGEQKQELAALKYERQYRAGYNSWCRHRGLCELGEVSVWKELLKADQPPSTREEPAAEAKRPQE